MNNRSGLLPLHVALSSNQGYEMIHFLIEKNPRATVAETSNGDLPIHIACEMNASAEVIHELIDSYEGGARIKGVSGDLPIHIAIEKSLDVGIISRLVKLYPECLVELGAKSRVPLNLAIELKASDDVILILLESYPTLRRKTKYAALQQGIGHSKRLPLHAAILLGTSTSTVLDMVDNYSDAARIIDGSNSNGELPIQLAIQLDRSVQVIVALLIAYPDSVDRCKPLNMKKLRPIVQEALSRPIHYWETKSLRSLSDVISELRGKAIDVASMVCEKENSENITAKTGARTFRSVADDVQLKLLDDIEILKKAISDTGASNAADIEELRCAFHRFKASVNEKVDAVERGTIVAVERLLTGEEAIDSSGDY